MTYFLKNDKLSNNKGIQLEITNAIFETLLIINQNHILTKTEEHRLKSSFLGTNFTADDILKGVRNKNQKILKKIEDNLPLNSQKRILVN